MMIGHYFTFVPPWSWPLDMYPALRGQHVLCCLSLTAFSFPIIKKVQPVWCVLLELSVTPAQCKFRKPSGAAAAKCVCSHRVASPHINRRASAAIAAVVVKLVTFKAPLPVPKKNFHGPLTQDMMFSLLYFVLQSWNRCSPPKIFLIKREVFAICVSILPHYDITTE